MSEYDELVKWLRDFADRHYHTERKEKAAQAANAIETLAKELYDARVVCGDTFDSARKWRASAEAAEARLKMLEGVLEGIARNADTATDLPLFRVQCRDFARSALEAKP